MVKNEIWELGTYLINSFLRNSGVTYLYRKPWSFMNFLWGIFFQKYVKFVGRENKKVWCPNYLGQVFKHFCNDQSRFCMFYPGDSWRLSITTPTTDWVTHIKRDFLTYYRDLEGRRVGIAQIYACVLLYFLLKSAPFDVPS